MSGAKVFEGGWVGRIFLLSFVVFFRPKSVVFISFKLSSIFTNLFHVVGGLPSLMFSFRFFKFKSKLGLPLLCYVAALLDWALLVGWVLASGWVCGWAGCSGWFPALACDWLIGFFL